MFLGEGTYNEQLLKVIKHPGEADSLRVETSLLEQEQYS